MTTSTTKKLITAALAVATLAVGSLAVTGDAMAKGKGKHGGGLVSTQVLPAKHGGWHGGHRWRHKWHGHRWHGRHFFFGSPYYVYGKECYFVRKKFSRKLIKICPDYYRY